MINPTIYTTKVLTRKNRFANISHFTKFLSILDLNSPINVLNSNCTECADLNLLQW